MASEKSTDTRKLQYVGIAVAILSLLVTFLVNFETISAPFYPFIFPPKANIVVESAEVPTYLPYDFRSSLTVPLDYYVVASADMKINPYQGEPLQVHITFRNIGKKSIQQPRIIVYFSDFMYRAWGECNQSVSNETLTKDFIVEYHFPPLDEKVTGTWIAFILLYDDATPILVSYIAKQFLVTDVAPVPFWQEPLTYVFIAYLGLIAALLKYQKQFRNVTNRLLKRKRKLNREKCLDD